MLLSVVSPVVDAIDMGWLVICLIGVIVAAMKDKSCDGAKFGGYLFLGGVVFVVPLLAFHGILYICGCECIFSH